MIFVSIDYCTVHDGIREEDDEVCDFSVDDDEERDCVLWPLGYAVETDQVPASEQTREA